MASNVMQGRLWIDISTVRGWQGTPHGIARVEAGLSSALARRLPNTRPVWMDRGRLRTGPTEELLALSDGYDSTTAAFDRPVVIPPWTDESARSAISALGLSSRGARLASGVAIASSALPGFLGVPLAASAGAVRRFRNPLSDGRAVRIARDMRPYDLVLITGADWNAGVVERLRRQPTNGRPRCWVLIHDLLPVAHPELLCNDAASARFAEWVRGVAAVAERVLVVSDHTRQDFLEFLRGFGVVSPVITVLTPAVGGSESPAEPVQPGNEIEPPYVLYVSTVERRKNHIVLVQAARSAIQRGEPFPTIVFVGSWGWGTNDLRQELLRDSQLQGRIRHLSGITDAQMNSLVDNASAVAFPSRFEGFGLPVAEARERGTPVIAADIPALREVLGEDAWFVDPHDSGAWRAALVRVAEGSRPTVGHVATRSWDDVARDVEGLLGVGRRDEVTVEDPR